MFRVDEGIIKMQGGAYITDYPDNLGRYHINLDGMVEGVVFDPHDLMTYKVIGTIDEFRTEMFHDLFENCEVGESGAGRSANGNFI